MQVPPGRRDLLAAIQFVRGDEQVRQNATVHDRFLHDPRHVFDSHAAIPDGLRVDDDRRSQFALIETTRRVGPHQRFEAAAFDFPLEGGAQGLGAVGIARAATAGRIAAIDADENVMRESGHELNSASRSKKRQAAGKLPSRPPSAGPCFGVFDQCSIIAPSGPAPTAATAAAATTASARVATTD
jgi:hypothetical protein